MRIRTQKKAKLKEEEHYFKVVNTEDLDEMNRYEIDNVRLQLVKCPIWTIYHALCFGKSVESSGFPVPGASLVVVDRTIRPVHQRSGVGKLDNLSLLPASGFGKLGIGEFPSLSAEK
ncbi:hypothetical protein AKJ41_03295 [candidate division MSBL1 archaeon SCGC-AAA259O05]|uniref:Uncharacterized protein n=1 Tax=candidate division MSBL1 archaeon SCGC-AAA259O05 TaxID=1698271 RepID=A0A133V3C0_9EURY|nr:hypothetical protein AKJ41_03295 [candidate division MSBL1 archaeon SCGC-AAA259O05]